MTGSIEILSPFNSITDLPIFSVGPKILKCYFGCFRWEKIRSFYWRINSILLSQKSVKIPIHRFGILWIGAILVKMIHWSVSYLLVLWTTETRNLLAHFFQEPINLSTHDNSVVNHPAGPPPPPSSSSFSYPQQQQHQLLPNAAPTAVTTTIEVCPVPVLHVPPPPGSVAIPAVPSAAPVPVLGRAVTSLEATTALPVGQQQQQEVASSIPFQSTPGLVQVNATPGNNIANLTAGPFETNSVQGLDDVATEGLAPAKQDRERADGKISNAGVCQDQERDLIDSGHEPSPSNTISDNARCKKVKKRTALELSKTLGFKSLGICYTNLV